MTKLIIAIVLTLTSIFANAQLKGSGKTVTRTYDYQNFNKVFFDDLDGKLQIEVGKSYGISITIDDNLNDLLSVLENQENKSLTLALKGNKNNRMYIEDTNIKIVITMPYLMEVSNNGNSGLTVTNINSKNFKITNPENGSTTLSGIVDNLEVIDKGNGNLNAEKLIAKKAKIVCRGNGNVRVNVTGEIEQTRTGNGNIVNVSKLKNTN